MKKNDYKLLLPFLAISIVLLTICNPNSFLYKASTSHDASVYYVLSKGMLQGELPYRDLFDHKGPFTYFIYALYNIVFPCKMYGAWIMDVICYTTINIFTYKLFRQKSEPGTSVVFSAIIFFVILFFNTSFGCVEIFSTLLNAVIIYWMYTNNTNKNGYLVFFGLMTGALLMIKFTLTAFPFIMFLWFVYDNINKKTNVRIIVNKILILVGTMFIPLLISLAYLIKTDTLSDFLKAYIVSNGNYAFLDKAVIISIFVILIILLFILTNKRIDIREKIFLSAFAAQLIFIRMSLQAPYAYLPLTVIAILLFYKYLDMPSRLNKALVYFSAVATIFTVINGTINIIHSHNTEYAIAGPNDITLFCIHANIFVEQETAPANKYFYTPNFSYSEKPEMWDDIYNMIDNKIPNNIYIPYYCGDEYLVTDLYISDKQIDSDKAVEMLKRLKENYTCEKEYQEHLFKWTRK